MDAYPEFWLSLRDDEKPIVDFLRSFVKSRLPSYCKEKFTNGVPYFYGKHRICLIWPASIKGGGIRNGVLFGFSKGNELEDKKNYLTHGTNKRIFYKVYCSLDEIDAGALNLLLIEAVRNDMER